MGKDRKSHRKVCMRCDNWAEDGSELCTGCEQNVLEEMAFEKRAQDVGPLIASWEYADLLDQARADSLEGGE